MSPILNSTYSKHKIKQSLSVSLSLTLFANVKVKNTQWFNLMLSSKIILKRQSNIFHCNLNSQESLTEMNRFLIPTLRNPCIFLRCTGMSLLCRCWLVIVEDLVPFAESIKSLAKFMGWLLWKSVVFKSCNCSWKTVSVPFTISTALGTFSLMAFLVWTK